MDDLNWMDPPPPRKRGRINVVGVVATLQANPGKWARIAGPYKPQSGGGGYRFMFKNKPGFECVSRRINEETWIFARYVGNGSAE